MRNDIIPPDPSLFLKDFILKKKIEVGEETSHCVLRRGADAINEIAYVDFLSMFGACLFHDREWKKYSTSKRVSEYMDVSLEAFGVTVYYNNYYYWKQMFDQKKEKESSTKEGAFIAVDLTSRRTTFVSSLSSSSGRYYRWTRKGIQMYNDIRRVLDAQRKMTVTREFEQKVLNAICMQQKKDRQKKTCKVVAENSLQNLFNSTVTVV